MLSTLFTVGEVRKVLRATTNAEFPIDQRLDLRVVGHLDCLVWRREIFCIRAYRLSSPSRSLLSLSILRRPIGLALLLHYLDLPTTKPTGQFSVLIATAFDQGYLIGLNNHDGPMLRWMQDNLVDDGRLKRIHDESFRGFVPTK